MTTFCISCIPIFLCHSSPKLSFAPRPFFSYAHPILSFQPTLYQIPSLYCSYETNSNAYLLLQPIRKEVIHLEPYIALYHDFVSDSEAQKIRELAEPWVSVLRTRQEFLFHLHMPGVQECKNRRPEQLDTSKSQGVQNANHSIKLVHGGKNHNSACLWRERINWMMCKRILWGIENVLSISC